MAMKFLLRPLCWLRGWHELTMCRLAGEPPSYYLTAECLRCGYRAWALDYDSERWRVHVENPYTCQPSSGYINPRYLNVHSGRGPDPPHLTA